MASSNRCALLSYKMGRAAVSQRYRHLQYVVFWVAGILSRCCQQQLMKIFRVTVGKARTRSISLFSKLRNNAYFL